MSVGGRNPTARRSGATLSELRRDFSGPVVLSTIAGGVVAGVVTTGFAISYAALIFKGDDLAVHLPVGTGLVLAATLVVGVVSALWSSVRGLMAGIQDATSALLGIAAASVVAGMASDDAVAAVVALVAVSSIGTGLVLFLLGRFRFGGLARFLPYTLVGGFLAATGVVIIQGGVSIVDAGDGGWSAPSFWGVWLPAGLIGGGFIVLQRQTRMRLTFPIGIVGATVVLHLGFLAAGSSRAESIDRGWLLGSGEDVAWSPAIVGDALGADWAAVFSEIGAIATVTVLAAVALLLYAHSLEEALHRDIDLNRELMVAGAGNVAAGLVGGAPGYAYVADTVLLHRLGAPRRGAALVAAAVVGIALIAGPTLLSWIPRGVVGGLLFYVGATVVIDWVWGARDRLTVVDQAVILAVVVSVAVVGLVTGVVVGLTLAVVTFVVRYSKVGVIERALTLDEVPVSVERPESEAKVISEAAPGTMVLELNGYLFFGTAHLLVEAVQRRLRADPPLRYVIFSLEHVTGVDASALNSFERVVRYGADAGFVTIIAGTVGGGSPLRVATAGGRLLRVDDLDDAVRVCQEEILRDAGGVAADRVDHSLSGLLEDDLGEEHADRALALFERIELGAGERIIVQGEPSPGLFYLESGRLTAVLEQPPEPDLKLRTMRPGTIVGEMSLYRETEAAATVVADEPAVVMHVSVDRFAELSREDPEVTAWLHRFVARTLATRIDHANRTIRALRH